jgi:hypothetical protein
MNVLLKRSGQMFASSATVADRTEVLQVSALLLLATRRNNSGKREEREVCWGKVVCLQNKFLHKRWREEKEERRRPPATLYTGPGPQRHPR